MGLAATVGYIVAGLCLAYVVIVTTVAAVVAVRQEQKIWRPSNLPSLNIIGCIKVFIFNMLWMGMCAAGSIFIGCKWVLTLGTSDISMESHTLVEKITAILCVKAAIGKVKVVGAENLPSNIPGAPAPVYIANHASQIDLGVVYFLERRFKWIAKSSVLYVPGVGLTMYLGGHVLINRVKGKNKKSVATLFDKSNAAVQSGIPMFFFPQGTRYMAERYPFKDGAFIVAQTNKSPIIPISIDIPLGVWNSWYPLFPGSPPEVVLTVHKPIPVTGEEDREALKKQCFDQIYSFLPPIWKEEGSEESSKKDR